MQVSLKKVLFIDRDGTIIVEPPVTFQVDSLEKLAFVPRAITALARIAQEFDFELVMVTNQDGLGTASFPEETFWPAHNAMLATLAGEGITFAEVLIDRSHPADNAPTRKPRTGLLTRYMEGNGTEYDIAHSFVIGDRMTDVELAQNLGCKAIQLSPDAGSSATITPSALVLRTMDWDEIVRFLAQQRPATRTATVRRTTNETDIEVELALDGAGGSMGSSDVVTGIGFFDHMVEQLARHSGCDLRVRVRGDLYIDDHHTIEDTALALGEAFREALGDKRGIERYGYSLLPMDEALAQVAIDFSGRNWLVWDVPFTREKVGEMSTEMVQHFFKSFSDAAKCTLNICTRGQNNHHIIEATFKGVARAVKMAIRQTGSDAIPSTKGVL
jgi:imidazoleglycerol-phosphate dehydratase/histidinol-phosphatase